MKPDDEKSELAEAAKAGRVYSRDTQDRTRTRADKR